MVILWHFCVCFSNNNWYVMWNVRCAMCVVQCVCMRSFRVTWSSLFLGHASGVDENDSLLMQFQSLYIRETKQKKHSSIHQPSFSFILFVYLFINMYTFIDWNGIEWNELKWNVWHDMIWMNESESFMQCDCVYFIDWMWRKKDDHTIIFLTDMYICMSNVHT